MENQPEATLVELFRYNNWANAQVIAACRKLNAEQLDTASPGAYGSIRDTLEHIIRAEAGYVGRITGERPQPAFEWRSGADLADLAAFAVQVGEALLEVVQNVPPTQMVHEEYDTETYDYRTGGLFIQILNHGIEHRTNITTILSGLGIEAPQVDGWGYMGAYPERFDYKEGTVGGG